MQTGFYGVKKMAKIRIGKNERWVLIHCYLKTVKREVPDDWKLPRAYCLPGSPCTLKDSEFISYDDYFWKYLFKSEILLNYFDLKYSRNRWREFPWQGEYFKGYGHHQKKDPWYDWDELRKNIKAMVSYLRLSRTLTDKGLISVRRNFGPNSDEIELTEAGKVKAESILNVKGDALP
jgi:hypothetical protein